MSQIGNAVLERANNIVVGMADLQISDDTQVVIVTYALGSCIAVCVHDPVRHAAAMIHYMLPLSRVAPHKAETNPAMFADTGIPLLFEKMFALGCLRRDLVVKVVGGGNFFVDKELFNIGPRNYTVARKLLWKNGIMIAAEDVGGKRSRTVRFFVGDGRVVISSRGQDVEL